MESGREGGPFFGMTWRTVANVNAMAKDGQTPLHLAAHEGYGDVVTALLAAGADVNARYKEDGGTPLHAATQLGRVVRESGKVAADGGGSDAALAMRVGASPRCITQKFHATPAPT